MHRFQRAELGNSPRIALISNDALGNYVVLTPLIQMLRATYPAAQLDYYGGIRTAELWAHEELLSWGFPLHGSRPFRAIEAATARGPYDWVINVESSDWARCFAAAISNDRSAVTGPVLDHDGRGNLPFEDDERGALWEDRQWISPELTNRYPFLETPFIGEIFARLCYLEGEIPRYRLPIAPIPDDLPKIWIATSASLSEKIWTTENWLEILRRLRQEGARIGLLGAKPTIQARFWRGSESETRLVEEGGAEDWRGRLSLSQVHAALREAEQIITLDNGILHMAAATDTPTVGLFREGIHRLWAPPIGSLTVLHGAPVADIPIDQVWQALSGVHVT